MFTIFVAIDLSGGRVVRLLRGDPAAATVYSQDPVATALGWEEQGATYLHVVDLDGAISGSPANAAVMEAIVSAVGIPVEVAGGIRSLDAIEHWLGAGAARVCIGTKAIDDTFLNEALASFGSGVLAAVDARGGLVQVDGWQASSALTTDEVLTRLSAAGLERVLFTDIGRDGTLQGPNLEATAQVLAAGMGVIASGGVAGVGDIAALVGLGHPRLEGVVVGKALYSGAMRLDEALAAAAAGASARPA